MVEIWRNGDGNDLVGIQGLVDAVASEMGASGCAFTISGWVRPVK